MRRRQSRHPHPAHQHDAGGAEEERNLADRSALASLAAAAARSGEREVTERRAADRERQRLCRAAKKARRTPSKVLRFAADASLDGLVPTPAASVHHAKAAVVTGIVNDDLLEKRHLPRGGIFHRWNREGKLEGLFGDGVFDDDDDAYVRSASASKRFSYELPANDPWVKRLVEHVGGRLRDLGILHPERHYCGGAGLLLSKQHAPRQSWHTDYKWSHRVFERGLDPQKRCVPYPVSVLIALHEEGAWLRVRDGEDIFVDRYGAVVFRGDLTHAGAEWNGASYNWRIHLYFDSIGREWACTVPRKGFEAREGRYITVIKPPDPE